MMQIPFIGDASVRGFDIGRAGPASLLIYWKNEVVIAVVAVVVVVVVGVDVVVVVVVLVSVVVVVVVVR